MDFPEKKVLLVLGGSRGTRDIPEYHQRDLRAYVVFEDPMEQLQALLEERVPPELLDLLIMVFCLEP
jgi:hypothetical protein